jgi:intracellular sulfur oxidation DsrE/DsrF family protein
MKRKSIVLLYLLAAVFFCSAVSDVSAGEYDSLKGMESAKAIVDFRMGDPKAVVPTMSLVHQAWKDLAELKKNPAFVVVFMGPAVKLISKNREGLAPEDQKSVDELAKIIAAMSKDGIKFEVCVAAARAFKVDPASILSEIMKVENGWISEIGYQAQGYSLVPVF